jgi:predicted nucleotidyltransferase
MPTSHKERMKTLGEIKETLSKHKEEVAREFKVKEIGIFGSVVRGEQQQRSDIDILVEYYELPDLLKLIELERRLQRILGKKVDLVEKGGLRPELRERILAEVVYI